MCTKNEIPEKVAPVAFFHRLRPPDGLHKTDAFSVQSIRTGLRRASAVLLRYHMKQQSAAFHAAGAAYPGDDI